MNNDNWIDDLLDAHLREADNAQPPLGMESRILARISEGRKNAGGTFLWMACAGAAIVVLAVLLSLVRREPTPPPHLAITASTTAAAPIISSSQPPQPRIAQGIRSPRKRQQKSNTTTPADSRPDVFPSPSPLSEQERLALAYLQTTPRSELIAMSRPDDFPLLEMNQRMRAPDSVPKPFNSTR